MQEFFYYIYTNVIQSKEGSPEVRHTPHETPCIYTTLYKSRVSCGRGD